MESQSPHSQWRKVLRGDIPHILEQIFIYLDYESLKTCFEVGKDWRKILKSKSFQKKAKDVFAREITKDGKKLVNASGEGNTEVIMQLLATDFLDINREAVVDDHNYFFDATPLIIAAYEGKVNAVKLLLDRGADPNLQLPGEIRSTALHHAAEKGEVNAVILLLDWGADPNLKNEMEDTALHYAALDGHNNVVHVLLERRADPNITSEDGDTSLHYGARYGRIDAMQMLLDQGADPNIKNKYGETPLHDAARHGHRDVMQLLLDKGVDPNIKNGDGNSPLSVVLFDAQWRGNDCWDMIKIDDEKERRSLAQILLDGGANVI